MKAEELAAELNRPMSITPGWARCYDFGTGRVPAFLRKLAACG
jgi:hypothetical protein